ATAGRRDDRYVPNARTRRETSIGSVGWRNTDYHRPLVHARCRQSSGRPRGPYSPGQSVPTHSVIRNHDARCSERLFASALADRIESVAESTVRRQSRPFTFSNSPSTEKDRVMPHSNSLFPILLTRNLDWPIRISIGVSTVLMVMLAVTAATTASGQDAQATPEATGERAVIGIEHRGPIRVVYQITSDDMKDGVGAGLFYLKKLHDSYIAAGIAPDLLDIRAVYHGPASVHLLTDEAWNRDRNETTGNPNTAILSELAERGVHVELCNTRRISNGWAKSDIHPDVLLVSGAYQRLID